MPLRMIMHLSKKKRIFSIWKWQILITIVLISKIYLSDHERKPDQWFSEHAILSCKNDDVDHLNSDILDMFSGEQKIMQSAGSWVSDSPDEMQNAMPVELLNSITVNGLPLSHLASKVGSPLMLLCNLDPSNDGLCNGTHLILTRFKHHF